MSTYYGDLYSGCTLFGAFTTVTTTGAPSALSGNPPVALIAWKMVGAWTCSTAGVTLALDCKGATGWNGFSVNTNADPAFYACGAEYALAVSGGTVGGTCVSYYTVGTFSLKNRSGLQPTVHARALDVSSGGEAGLDWANIGSPQTAQRLGCTSIYDISHVCNGVIGLTEQGIACATWNSLQANHDTCGSFGVLLDCQVSQVLGQSVAEPAAVFAWPSTPRVILAWLGALSSNCVRQTATVQTLRTRADAGSIATSNLTCDGTTVNRGSFA